MSFLCCCSFYIPFNITIQIGKGKIKKMFIPNNIDYKAVGLLPSFLFITNVLNIRYTTENKNVSTTKAIIKSDTILPTLGDIFAVLSAKK